MARDVEITEANQIGARLKEIRRGLEQTLAQVSKSTGVSISNLSKIEKSQKRGVRPQNGDASR